MKPSPAKKCPGNPLGLSGPMLYGGIGPVFTLLLPAEDVYSAKEHLEDAPLGRPAIFAPDEDALEAQTRHQAHDKMLLVVDDDPVSYVFWRTCFPKSTMSTAPITARWHWRVPGRRLRTSL